MVIHENKLFHIVITTSIGSYTMFFHSFQCYGDLSHEYNVLRHVYNCIAKYLHASYFL